VHNIKGIEQYIQKICPDVRTAVAHGQMKATELENIILDFISGDYDVLIATTIIENGLDIPNANTIIINNAQNFGVSDLHQLRGRVGRSNKKAYCYLLAPPLGTLPSPARRRLKAIEDFSELGSGFNIAMQDLDIRGAGNLLGREQSGFITDIGFEAYHRILDEALHELKQNEYKDVFKDENSTLAQQETDFESMKFVNDCQIVTDMELLFPDYYISNATERIHLYRKLDNMKEEEELQTFEHELTDRFGKLPPPSKDLLEVVRLRWLAMDLGFEKLILKNKRMIAYFVSDQESPYYQSPVFRNILETIQKNHTKYNLEEKNNKLSLSFSNITDIYKAWHALSEIFQQQKETVE
jgi:transcription-repair coupling factor (superfamily II helicase)